MITYTVSADKKTVIKTETNKLMDGVTIPASDFKKIQADWQMATGDTIQAKGSTNIATSIQLYGVESAL